MYIYAMRGIMFAAGTGVVNKKSVVRASYFHSVEVDCTPWETKCTHYLLLLCVNDCFLPE